MRSSVCVGWVRRDESSGQLSVYDYSSFFIKYEWIMNFELPRNNLVCSRYLSATKFVTCNIFLSISVENHAMCAQARVASQCVYQRLVFIGKKNLLTANVIYLYLKIVEISVVLS